MEKPVSCQLAFTEFSSWFLDAEEILVFSPINKFVSFSVLCAFLFLFFLVRDDAVVVPWRFQIVLK